MKSILFLVFASLICMSTTAGQDARLAEQYFRDGEFEKAAAMYKSMYAKNPNYNYLEKYTQSLSSLGRKEEAQQVVTEAYKRNPNDLYTTILYAVQMEEMGELEKAEAAYNEIVSRPVKSVNEIFNIASRLRMSNKNKMALKVYEKGLEQFDRNSEIAYSAAFLYREVDENEKMITCLLDAMNNNNQRMINIQSFIQRYLSKEDMEIVKNQLLERIQKDPSSTQYTEMLSWVFVQERNIAGALRQYIALDRRLSLDGTSVYDMGKLAYREGDYKAALTAFNYITQNRSDNQGIYFSARVEEMEVMKAVIADSAKPSPADIDSLRQKYNIFLAEFGKNPGTAGVIASFADFEGNLANNPEKGIALYRELLDIKGLNKYIEANAKLNLGDLYFIIGEKWEATLLYAQLDKSFRDEMLGQEARYRMARLSYYDGDFEWAKEQFNILKVATSRMISNDAIDKVVFINDNLNLDTTPVPMMLFAEGELLVARKLYDEALLKFRQITDEFPEHGLTDDILYVKAQIAKQRKDYVAAENFYLEIVNNYATDIKGDDAIFELAQLYETRLNRTEDALNLYERLFLEFENSIFAVEARKKYRELRTNEPSI